MGVVIPQNVPGSTLVQMPDPLEEKMVFRVGAA